MYFLNCAQQSKYQKFFIQTSSDKNLTEKGFRETSKPLKILVFASGFEPLAYRLGGGRSILLSYANMQLIIYRVDLIGKWIVSD